MPSPASDEVAAAIAAAPGGLLRFDHYMDLALYGAQGFYTRADGGRAGRRGDFLTSAEVGPLFAAVLARALDSWWEDLDRPDPFTVVEVGAGPGTLSRGVLAAQPACTAALRYVAVEVSDAQRAMHPGGVESVAVLPDGPFTGVILANELLDNLPFRLLVFDGRWRECCVTSDGGRVVEVAVPLMEAPDWLPVAAPHGARVPWQERAAEWVHDARSRLARGRVVAFDYTTATTAELAHEPWRTWLRTYRDHERGGHYLASPGEQDITAQIAIDQLPPPDRVESQATFLQRFGIDELVDEGRREWAANAARPTVAALAMRSRVREAEALLAPDGLGGFTLMEWCT